MSWTVSTKPKIHAAGKKKNKQQLFWECFYTSLRWAVRSFFLSPPSSIFLFIFAAPWLTGQSVAMECAVGQKKRRSRNSLTSWRGLTCFHHLSTHSPCLFLILSLVSPPPHLSFSTTLSLTLSLCQPSYTSMQAQVPLLGLFLLHSLSHTRAHAQTQSCILSLQQHRLVACTRIAPTLSHKQECVGISLWLPL